jgi:uncharacterized protein YndB with AHSA1/START domain
MPITNVEKDPEALTMTVTADLAAGLDRAWQLWADPRQLERWWGPPSYPASVVDHELVPGGRVSYYMTGPEGDKPWGWWEVVAVDPPRRLEFRDGFADDSGAPNPNMPVMTMVVTLAEGEGGGTRMVVQTTFPSVEAMNQLINMGMEQGISEAMGQIDAILAEPAAR